MAEICSRVSDRRRFKRLRQVRCLRDGEVAFQNEESAGAIVWGRVKVVAYEVRPAVTAA